MTEKEPEFEVKAIHVALGISLVVNLVFVLSVIAPYIPQAGPQYNPCPPGYIAYNNTCVFSGNGCPVNYGQPLLIPRFVWYPAHYAGWYATLFLPHQPAPNYPTASESRVAFDQYNETYVNFQIGGIPGGPMRLQLRNVLFNGTVIGYPIVLNYTLPMFPAQCNPQPVGITFYNGVYQSQQ